MSISTLAEPTSHESVVAAASLAVTQIDPLTDPRWLAFVECHPQSSVFHTRAWLQALQRSYGYRPVAYTTALPGQSLQHAVVFCEVRSVLTGKRLVSLPFSDHCQPLAAEDEFHAILKHVQEQRKQQRMRYLEIRPITYGTHAEDTQSLFESGKTSLQRVDLSLGTEQIYRRFHDSCIRRKIKKAEREGLQYQAGRSEELLRQFYQLLLLTRRRHKLPPQPIVWFRNLLTCLGDNIELHVVSKDQTPVASILTLRHKACVTYKYGCSNGEFHNLGGTPLIFWKMIQRAKESGANELDLGRSDYSDPGLIAFKEHLGAVSSELHYYRDVVMPEKAEGEKAEGKLGWARDMFARLPDSVLVATGSLLYRHIG